MSSCSARCSEEIVLQYQGSRALEDWLLLFKDGLGHCQQDKLWRAFIALSEGGKWSCVVRMTFLGTNIVAPVDVVHLVC
jgi:hypothetical protein